MTFPIKAQAGPALSNSYSWPRKHPTPTCHSLEARVVKGKAGLAKGVSAYVGREPVACRLIKEKTGLRERLKGGAVRMRLPFVT